MLGILVCIIFIPMIYSLCKTEQEDKNRKEKYRLYNMQKSPYKKIINESPDMKNNIINFGDKYDGILNQEFEN